MQNRLKKVNNILSVNKIILFLRCLPSNTFDRIAKLKVIVLDMRDKT